MASYSGSALYCAWISAAGGTTVLSGDYRTFTFDTSVNVLDGTAGADTTRERLVGLKDYNWSLTIVQQASGTAIISALAEGQLGTLNVGPEGNTAGKQKLVFPSITSAIRWNQPYNDIVEVTISGQANGAWSQSTW